MSLFLFAPSCWEVSNSALPFVNDSTIISEPSLLPYVILTPPKSPAHGLAVGNVTFNVLISLAQNNLTSVLVLWLLSVPIKCVFHFFFVLEGWISPELSFAHLASLVLGTPHSLTCSPSIYFLPRENLSCLQNTPLPHSPNKRWIKVALSARSIVYAKKQITLAQKVEASWRRKYSPSHPPLLDLLDHFPPASKWLLRRVGRRPGWDAAWVSQCQMRDHRGGRSLWILALAFTKKWMGSVTSCLESS